MAVRLGFIGLGKMGKGMVFKLLKEGQEVAVWNRSLANAEELKFKIQNSKFKNTIQNLKVAASMQDLVNRLQPPRVIWLMVPAGDVTQSVLDGVSTFVEKGDILIDGGNSYYKDTEKRSEKLKAKNVKYLGIGVSGGIVAEKEGYPLMVGGDHSAYEYIRPVLDSLAKPNGGYGYFGKGGAGHFVKMVHNAIEYGYMQSIGEGFGLLDDSEYGFDLEKIAKIYQKGSLISGFMMERTIEVLNKDPKLSKIKGIIGKASGETVWAVEEAKRNNLSIEIIERSLEIRNESETDLKIQKSFAGKMVAALRNVFGGHSVSQA